MNISKDLIIGQIVAEDYRTATIFDKAGIDFCCNGNRSIEDACATQSIDADKLVSKLQETIRSGDADATNSIDYKSWPADLLADYIEKKHHRYVRNQIPELKALLEKITRVHGGRHPELAEIEAHFSACATELTNHMKKEETILFPYIRESVRAKEEGTELNAPFGTVENPIRMMMHEHDAEGERFRKIKALSNDYTPPADGCNTYKVAFATLEAFEKDLHLHIHLENNILFPQAIELEHAIA